jgi:hypothetical protein
MDDRPERYSLGSTGSAGGHRLSRTDWLSSGSQTSSYASPAVGDITALLFFFLKFAQPIGGAKTWVVHFQVIANSRSRWLRFAK